MARILVVAEDNLLNTKLRDVLVSAGHKVICVSGVGEARERMAYNTLDLVIQDLQMLASDIEMLDTARLSGREVPRVYLADKEHTDILMRLLRRGVDEYILCPPDTDELLLRVDTILQDARKSELQYLVIGGFSMNPENRTMLLDGITIELSEMEFSILYKLLLYPDRALTRRQLLGRPPGDDGSSEYRTVDVHISKLRQMLRGCDAFDIRTVHGIGYKAVIKRG